MSLSYQGTEFSPGDRVLLSFEDKEWVVFAVPEAWAVNDGLSLDDTGFSVIGEVLYPDAVKVLVGRDTGFSIAGIDTVPLRSIKEGDELVVGKSDGTLVRFVVSDIDDGFVTSEVNGFEFDLKDSKSDWKLFGAY